jgi:uncharacterized membrane protein YfcA
MSADLLAGLVGFGLVAGAGAGLLGIGGGTLMVPFLVLAAGLTQHEAQATSLLAILPTSIVATIVLRRRGVGDLRTSFVIGGLGIAGALAGSLLALALPEDALRIAFALFLGAIGLRMARDGYRALTA